MWLRDNFSAVLRHVGWKLENSMKILGNILEVCLHIAELPRTLDCANVPFFLKVFFFPTPSVMVVAGRGLP